MARANKPPAKPPDSITVIPTVQLTVEREIKLTVGDHFRLPELPGTPIPRRRLTSTYYDTSQFDLAQAGITLRHRVERGKQAWQLKLALMKDRQEVELVDRQSVPPTLFRDLLFLHLGQRQLIPVTTLRVWRAGIRVRMDHTPVADVTLDHVSVMKDGAVLQRFRELEIEQVNGKNGALPDLERQLRRAGAKDHDGRPKLIHALSLVAPGPEPQPASDAPVMEHVKWTLARHVRWLIAHDPGTRLGREPESLHQMRVATRQLRAVLRAARPLLVPEWADSLRNELRWLGQLLGPARDLDVQLAYFREESATLDARDRGPLTQFIAHLEAQRNNVQEFLLNELKSERYLDLITRLQQVPHDPTIVESTVTLRDLAKQEFTKLRNAIRQAGDSPNNANIHKTRIRTKRARYASELAEPMVGKPATRFINKARAVQDVLGMHQDAIQAEAYIRAFLKQSTSARASFVAGRMVERQRQRQEKAREKMSRLLRSLVKRGEKAWG
ncbi:MAG TPA: CYTH and CHAD domain-containing protein [Nitrospiraceae bacterium]|nr:CYTH and CHAD domain-containing protein [Nitrospiraceae bacterium]